MKRTAFLLVLLVIGGWICARGQGSNYGTLQPGQQLVATLPAAAASNAGQIRVVSDSTSVSAEGQTCTGSSTNVALAFSNGSSWKCF